MFARFEYFSDVNKIVRFVNDLMTVFRSQNSFVRG